MAPAAVVAKALVALAAVGTLVECRFLADPPAKAPPAEDNSTSTGDDAVSDADADAQIAALSAQMDSLQSKVSDAKTEAKAKGVEVPEDDFRHHCKPKDKAALDKMKAEDIPEDASKKNKNKASEKKAGTKFDQFNLALEASNQKSVMENEEFLLGLLMHKDWSYEQQMDAICDLAGNNPMLIKLYKQHNKNETLAVQLARAMDEQSKHLARTKAPPLKLEGDSVGDIMKMVR